MTRHRITIGLGVASLLCTAACGGHGMATATGTATSTFSDQGNRKVSCMAHQDANPVAVDQPGAAAEDPASVLAVLRYYTANGNKPYCDGKPATATDRRWLTLYVAGGASKSNIRLALAG